MEQNKFITAEQLERKCIRWYIKKKGEEITNISISDIGSYSTDDLTFTSGGTLIIAEIKVRKFESNKYPTAYLELDKLNRMVKKGSEFANKPLSILYFAFYKEDKKLLIFDLLKTDHKIKYVWSPVSTMDLSRGYTNKGMVEYNIEDAIEIIDIN